ncbi:MAG: hypothetical protein MPW16_21250 (plasmid) [Candidatus Manganitrophus sp.]|nr:MAG: hypothetical protein MPW16_21250 [Candidatus Manganitrophus sp.]
MDIILPSAAIPGKKVSIIFIPPFSRPDVKTNDQGQGLSGPTRPRRIIDLRKQSRLGDIA